VISKKILIATLGLSTIALYSCGGKNNNKAPVAATSEKTKKEEKLIKVNFFTVTTNTITDTALTSAEILVNCGNGDTPYTLNSANHNISVLSGKVCTLKISAINNYRVADANKPLVLTLKEDGNIDLNSDATKFTDGSDTFYLNGKKVGDKITILVANQVDLLKEALTKIDSVTTAQQPSKHNVSVNKFDLTQQTYSAVKLSGTYDVERIFGSIKHKIVRTNITLSNLPSTPSDCKIASGTTAVDENDASLSNCAINSVNSPEAYTMFIKQSDGSFTKHSISAILVPADIDLTTSAPVRAEKDLLQGYFDSVSKHLKSLISLEDAKINVAKANYDLATDTDSFKNLINDEVAKIDTEASNAIPNNANLVNIRSVLTSNTKITTATSTDADVKTYVDALLEKLTLLDNLAAKSEEYKNRNLAL